MHPTTFVDALLGHVPGLEVMLLDAEGRCRHARGQRLDALETAGRGATALFAAEWQAPVLEAVDRAAAGVPATGSITDPGGSTLVVAATPDATTPGGVVLTLRDVTVELRTARRARTAAARFDTVFENSRAALSIVDADLAPTDTNPATAALTGLPMERHRGGRVMDVLHPDEVGAVIDAIAGVVDGERASSTIGHRLLRPDGRVLQVRTHTQPIELADGGRGALIETVDVSDEHVLADELQRYTTRDPLTGLLNREGLEAQLRELTGRDGRRPAETTLMLANVDDFAQVNAQLGTTDGDLVLREIAGALRAAVREGDPVARLGGDEFAVLLPGLGTDAAEGVAEAVLARFSARLHERGGDADRLGVTVSIGLGSVTLGAPLDDALAGAGIAVYAAKQAGKGRWMVGL